MLSMIVLLPIAAMVLVAAWDFSMPVRVALLTLAVSPLPPILPSKELKVVSREDYVWSLFIISSLLAIVLVPLLVSVLGFALHRDDRISVGLVAKPILISVLVPLFLGMVVRYFWRDFAIRVRGGIARVGNGLLVLACVVILVFIWPRMREVLGNGSILAFVALAVIGLIIGHLMGGPKQENRSVLALATATRHPGIAIAIGAVCFPDDKSIPAAVLLALLVSIVVSIPYTRWRRKIRLRGTPGEGAADS
jgi:BASS family bile acid:Na+ symporter